MNQFTIHIEIEDPAGGYTEDLAEDLAELGGAASYTPHRVGATFTVDAKDIAAAAGVGVKRATKLAAGQVVALEVLTVDEHDRQLAQPAFPELVGITEVAELLGVTRQRASSLRSNAGFPAPVAELRSGPVWRKGDLSRFADTWTRKPGRPRKELVAGA